MKKRTLALLLLTHGVVGFTGFAGGIYALPILTAPPAPSAETIKAKSAGTEFTAEFKRDLKDSDALHWGEGTVSVGPEFITLMGTLAPGPDYKLYLSPEFVETESDFNRLKSSMVQVGDIKTFENFAVEVSPEINPSDFNSVIVWCESFGQFITAAKYQ
ncbi:putative Electron transfer DM13 domain protein [Vibrio nigripulchritudo SOn1]|uniref:Electron transfer DM13 domain protein n=1 Tax=Vibrio nigripulchritudo SOn1 TaxID=1238450 RepID=A0AAV2VSX4_9VIBR|nr:DM13 domain-containing protein [Vibrio nigripulchritudo]CCO47770.1 putative Electron transfer DM13 domain protein [Vibrio nigripulchritudo SOn1]